MGSQVYFLLILLKYIKVLDDVENNNANLSVYPNPVRDEFKFEGVNLNTANVSIIDVLGKKVEKSSYTLNGDAINVSELSNGTYFVIISNENEVIGQSKFVKF